MDSDSNHSEVSGARARQRLALWIPSVSALIFVALFLSAGSLAAWILMICVYAGIQVLVWRQWSGWVWMRQGFEQKIEGLESGRQALQRRVGESERLLAQVRDERDRQLEECEREKTELANQLAAEKQRAAASQLVINEIQATVARLNRENAGLAEKGADAISRRQSLQSQYFELEKTANEMKLLHLEKSEQQRGTFAELQRLHADLKTIQAERDSANAEVAQRKRELATLGMEQANASLREAKLRAEATEWQSRAEAAGRELRNLQAGTALQEELSSRRAEIDRLIQHTEELVRQRDFAAEHSRLLDEELNATKAQLPALTRQIESSDQVIGELQDECRQAHQEPRHEMDRHFTWKLNFFKEREVVLNFLNEGAGVDLIGVVSDPELRCELMEERRLKRGAEGRIRVTSGQRLPDDFTLTVRYTIYPQEARLRIRPFEAAKIERI